MPAKPYRFTVDFLAAYAMQGLYGGSMVHPDGTEKTVFGINVGVIGFGWVCSRKLLCNNKTAPMVKGVTIVEKVREGAMSGLTQVSQGNYIPTKGMRELLRRWFYLKFVQKKSTVELMATACDLRNKSALSIVALLDVDEQMISQVVSNKRLIFVQNCHAYLKGSVNPARTDSGISSN